MSSKVKLDHDEEENEHEEPKPPVVPNETESAADKFSPARKDAFSRYLEDIGFVKAMTQVVVELYEEPVKPVDPVEYFLNRIVTNVPLKESLKSVREEIAAYEKQLTTLMSDNQTLREKLLRHEAIFHEEILDAIEVDQNFGGGDNEKKEEEQEVEEKDSAQEST